MTIFWRIFAKWPYIGGILNRFFLAQIFSYWPLDFFNPYLSTWQFDFFRSNQVLPLFWSRETPILTTPPLKCPFLFVCESYFLKLWDTAGQERFRSLIPSYIRDSNVGIIVYNVSEEKSFAKIDTWIKDVKDQRGEDVIIFLVGNKVRTLVGKR